MEQKPGLLQTLDLKDFGLQEREITNNLSASWFVSYAKVQHSGPKKRFPYIFLKPVDEIKERFNLNSEILCVFHPYPSIDGRVLEAIKRITKSNGVRLDRLCVFLISNADSVSPEILSKFDDGDPRIFVPFKYQEITGGVAGKDKLIKEKLEQSLYTKDLFAISSVLKTDRFFFGRKEEVQRIVGQYKNGENGSVFGLRRIGKSSLLWAVVRQLKEINSPVALIDCTDPGIHKVRWNKTLFKVKEALFRTNGLDSSGHTESEYTEEYATKCFSDDLTEVKGKFQKPSYLIFDEIENITFDVSPTDHWRTGEDFLLFWQSIRSTYQQFPNIFSFLICGTNPLAIETRRLVDKYDNPIYKYVATHYLGFFNVDDIETMIKGLGSYMGLTFEREIFTYLTDDFGGHPFLIKQVCSYLWNKKATSLIPRKIHLAKNEYDRARPDISTNTRNYIELILEILTERYPKEFALLRYLAAGDEEKFERCAEDEPTLIEHLLGYGLLKKIGGKYVFRINLVESAVRHDARDLACPESITERWALISKERNSFEYRLKELVRQTLKIGIGHTVAKQEMLSCMQKSGQIEKAELLEFDHIFKGEIYFLDLKRVVLKHWEKFKFAFDDDKRMFSESLDAANKHRSDAHAKNITRDEFKNVMPKLVWLNKALDRNS